MGTRVLPFIRDLNPRIDDIPQLVRLAHRHQGDRAKLTAAILRSWKKAGTRKGFSTHSISANTIASLGPENLGILTADGRLTQFGRALYAISKDPNRFRDALTKEVLLNHGGWQFGRALQVLGQAGKRAKREDVANYLAGKYGIEEWRDLNNISSLHSLLEWGGVVKNYRLVEPEFTRITGVTPGEVQTLEAFPQDTRDCFEALVRLGGTATAGDIRALAEALGWRLLNVHQMPAILKPLSDAGLVQFVGKKGDKQSLYSILDSEKASALERFASDLSLSGVVPDAIFEQTFASIVEQLKSKELSKDQRARTLEVLAAKICWRLGLRHIQIRNRTEFEVDVVADRTGPGYYQRWLVQCKAYGNASIRSEHILREFGIASLVGYDAILFVTTSTYSDDAIKVISNIIRKANVLVLPISGADLQAFAENEASLFRLLESRSHDARRMRLGANPEEVFRELDAMKDVLLKDKPVPADVWLRLERRQILMEFDVFLLAFATWLESQRGTEGFDEDYLTAVRTP